MDYEEVEDTVLDSVQAILDAKSTVEDVTTKAIQMAQNSNNPMIQHTVKIVQSVLEVGNQIPYIGPICNILTFIVQVEMKAREAEKKCTDLVERINFMVGHLTVLDKVPLISATEAVLNKMALVLKDAATLIQTYRKQSKIARRLNLGNKDKFDSCFTSIEKCSADLMFSLQIHQTHKLDELSQRKDDELDLEAERFIQKHGGIANIKNNEQLVRQFAAEFKIPVDESVMQELNANISSLLIENQNAIENILKDNLSSEISKGFEEFAKLMVQADVEEQLNCVQCGEKHRASHHNDYPYSKYFEMVYKVDLDLYINIEDEGLEEDLEPQQCCVGKLLRWTRFTSDVNTDILIVRVGKTLQNGPNFFSTYTKSALEIISSCYKLNEANKLIHRNYQSEEEYSYAEWVVDDEKNVIGVCAAVKSKTSDIPTVEKVIFNPSTLAMVSHERISTQYFNFQPSEEYVLPETISIGRMLPEGQSRKPRKFKTFGGLQPHVHFSTVADIVPNNPVAREGHDIYKGKLSLFNKTKETVVIMDLGCSYRLVGDEQYKEVAAIEYNINFPCAIEPLTAIEIEFSVTIERDLDDVNYKTVIWNTDFLTRDRPLRLKFNATDMEDRVGYYVLEYVHYFDYIKRDVESQYQTLVICDYERIKRYCMTPKVNRNVELDLDKISIRFAELDKVVYKALKQGIAEYEFPSSIGDYFEIRFWGLIDSSCKRIYAIKVLMTQKEGNAAVLAYVRLPLYGDNMEQRPIKYAKETVKFPDVREPVVHEFADDDEIDDIVTEKPGAPPVAAIDSVKSMAGALDGSSNVTVELMGTLNSLLSTRSSQSEPSQESKILEKLEAIEGQLARTANSIDQLVGIFTKLSRDRERQQSQKQTNDIPAMAPSKEFAPKESPEEGKFSMCF
ncbi:hypothetical protein HK103_006816 [Boothiomyces macroporosus]|uniref:Mixed lineage kinase domain-containing protein n=1 Tax=Boothiomyces macroporosus TaxID=261099 RepID=A0AAD5UGH9_9FUNG|nr:hypothetical protein HK103_006816 [Boothiomyces macroporosus]